MGRAHTIVAAALLLAACDGILKGGRSSDGGADRAQQLDQPGPGSDSPVERLAGVDLTGPGTDAKQPGTDSKPPKADSPVTKADSKPPKVDAPPPPKDAPVVVVDSPKTTGCTLALPAEAQLVNTSSPKTVVGTGTGASCTHAALAAAIAQGGVITFNCGSAAAVIPISATLAVPTDRDTVLDGGNKVTLDGGGSVQILRWSSPGWMTNTHLLTLQRLTLINGKATPGQAVPACPAPCSQGWADGQGGAVFMRDGTLHVIDCTFSNNQAALLGPDTGGGAIYVLGSQPLVIAGSTFKSNTASNAGAVGTLFAKDSIYNSVFDGNKAVGNGANNVDPAKCTCNPDNQVGSGGNGGTIYSDGVGVDVFLCGVTLTNNTATEFGAAVFFTSNDSSKLGTLTIRDSTFTHNTGNGIWEAKPGVSTNASFPAPINTTFTP